MLDRAGQEVLLHAKTPAKSTTKNSLFCTAKKGVNGFSDGNNWNFVPKKIHQKF